MLLSQKVRSAMKGMNAEFGWRFGKYKCLDFFAAAGPYYYVGKVAPSTVGGRARISTTYNNILSLELSDSYDRTFIINSKDNYL